jgi:hypothetical protein
MNQLLRRKMLVWPFGLMLVEAKHANDQLTRVEQDCVLQLGAPCNCAVDVGSDSVVCSLVLFRGGGTSM